jgi:excisionase family DNA binding protein
VSDIIAQIEGWGRMMLVDELAQLTAISPKTLYRMIQRRKLPGHKIGDCIRLNPQEVADWLRSRQF